MAEKGTQFFNQIPVPIIEAEDLNDFEKLLFSEIYTMANSFGSVFPSNAFLAERYGKSKKTISVSLKSLQEKEYIRMEYEFEGKEVRRRYILPNLQKCKGGIYVDVNTPIQKRKEGMVKNVKETISSNKSNTISSNNMSDKPDNAVSEILAYLNEKAGTGYRASSKKTQSLVKARFSEGYNLDDFKTVIDNKVSSWKGTEWEKYLRPETLFSPKFEGYLNEKPRAKAPERQEYTDLDLPF